MSKHQDDRNKAIYILYQSGEFSLDDIGKLFDGLTRQRVHQIVTATKIQREQEQNSTVSTK